MSETRLVLVLLLIGRESGARKWREIFKPMAKRRKVMSKQIHIGLVTQVKIVRQQ